MPRGCGRKDKADGAEPKRGAPVLLFSLEMAASQLSARILSEQTEIEMRKIRTGRFTDTEWDRFVHTAQVLGDLPLYIDDTGGISIAQIAARARRMKREKKIGLIVIDYLQLVEPSSRRFENRVQEISDVTKGLKALAKELDVPVMALSQLSRGVDNRDDKRPMLSDLRESGSIEQDADVVMFVYREEYYLKSREPEPGSAEYDEWLEKMERVHNRAEIMVEKHRHGPTNKIELFFDENFTRFSNLAFLSRGLRKALRCAACWPVRASWYLTVRMPRPDRRWSAHKLTPVLNALEEIDAYAALARGKLEAAIQVDTGISRSGLSREAIAESGARLKNIELVMVLSQLACADEPKHPQNKKQLERFRAALAALPSAPASLAASAGVHLGRDYLFDFVRPGVALYGGNPVAPQPTSYRPVVSLTARVLQVRHVDTGGSVGYGATFTAARPSTLAVVALGYADGIPRALQAHGGAAIVGHCVPFAGRISMDLMALDITGLPAGLVKPGTEVELIGDTITVDDVARAGNTIPHEVLTALHPRAQRVYEA